MTPVSSSPSSALERGSTRDPGHLSERKKARQEKWRLLRRRPTFIIGSIILLFWTICALIGDKIVPHDPLDFRGPYYASPSASFPFGTDVTGRDIFSRVIVGSRDVLKVAPLAAFIGVALGVILGLLTGYLGGWFDTILGRILESFLALPAILIGLLAVTTLGRSSWVVIGIVAVLFTPIVARTVRSAVMAERDLDYVTSAKLRGESAAFIMFREILPNVWGPIIVEFTIRVGYAIFVVATLTFLGAGPAPPSPDWGAMVNYSYGTDLAGGFWWTTVFPALAIASLVIAVNLIADAVSAVVED
jgi:peptide/nickel transport system permease protein